MTPQHVGWLAKALTATFERHHDMVGRFDRACTNLVNTVARVVGNLRTPQNNRLFAVRVETQPDPAVVIRRVKLRRHRETRKRDPLARRVLNLQPGGLGYYPGNGVLCGVVYVILSDGDYLEKLKGAKVGVFDALVNPVGSALARDEILAQVGDISRQLLDELYYFGEEPGLWHRALDDSGELEKVDIERYVGSLIDYVYNPEGKVGSFQ